MFTKLNELLDRFGDKSGIVAVGVNLPMADDEETETTLAIPGYRQTQTYTCGFVAGLMVLHTFKPRASINRFFWRVKPDPEYGTEPLPLTRALRRSGIGVAVRENLTFDAIAEALEAGYPIITLITAGFGAGQHWVVVYGYGVSPNRIFVAGSGFFAKEIMDWGTFRKRWNPKGFGMLCWGK